MALMRIGIVGCGNIATDICSAVCDGTLSASVAALTDIDASRAKALQEQFNLDAPALTLPELAASVDFIVECAVASVVPDVVTQSIEQRVDCLIMSLGGLVECAELLDNASSRGVHIWLPTGAICGLDGVRAAARAGLDSVTLTTRKPPRGLQGAPWLVANGISVDNLSAPLVVFEGSVRDAVKAFPANINVAAALSLAGIGPDRTKVLIVADPDATVNSHEVRASGAFGELVATTRNCPSPRNPKSSYLASLSACAEVAAAAKQFQSRQR